MADIPLIYRTTRLQGAGHIAPARDAVERLAAYPHRQMKQRTLRRPADPDVTTRQPFNSLPAMGDVYPRVTTKRALYTATPPCPPATLQGWPFKEVEVSQCNSRNVEQAETL
jgi:hypothetical protein